MNWLLLPLCFLWWKAGSSGLGDLTEVACVLATLTVLAAAALFDRDRGTALLAYDMDDPTAHGFERLHRAFDSLRGLGAMWHLSGVGARGRAANLDGVLLASHRVNVRPRYGLPDNILSNVTCPVLAAGKQTLYFFPNFLLVDEGRSVGALAYRNVSVTIEKELFLEKGSVAPDSRIVGQTWEHVTKSGQPDRRFRSNEELRVIEYELVGLRSARGLNELFVFSQLGSGARLQGAMAALAAQKSEKADSGGDITADRTAQAQTSGSDSPSIDLSNESSWECIASAGGGLLDSR